MIGQGLVIGKKAPDFTLPDHQGGQFNLLQSVSVTPTLLVFYPGDFTMVCTKQLCDYRDHLEQFVQLGVQIVGISKNSTSEHIKFARAHKFPFLLLSDSGQSVAKMYGCTSLLMMGTVSRAVFIVNTQGIILYRYVEPIALTRRTADELLDVISDLKGNQLI